MKRWPNNDYLLTKHKDISVIKFILIREYFHSDGTKLFEQHNAEFEKKIGYSCAQGTFSRYRTVCKHIRKFLPLTYHREDIPLKELNLTFINDFEYFLREEKKC